MKNKQSLRSQLGLTITDWAMLLGVTPSQVSMTESGLRELPPKAGLKETQLLLLTLDNKEIDTAAYDSTHAGLAGKMLKDRSKALKHKHDNTVYKLKGVAETYKKHEQLYNLLIKMEGLSEQIANDKEWLDILKRRTLFKLEKYGLHHQLLLQMEIDNMRSEMEKIDKLQEEIAGAGKIKKEAIRI